ncbi:MAG: hypothetical protein HY557_02115 [Euryarchaeota archaeon]|nr:hypothetical protein [Euryarchaeota archaeon]
MASTKVTFEVSAELKELMRQHPDVNWSAVFRDAVVRHARALELARQVLQEEEDLRVRELAQRLKRGAGERFRRARHARRR